MTGLAPVAGVLLGALALLAGYLVGSLPAAARIGRMAGVDLAGSTWRRPAPGGGPAAVWRLAGPGWGFLALTADLAKGVVPVAIGIVTFSWAIGWVAGLGAVLGAGWPAFGARGAVTAAWRTFGGAAFTLAPPAGMLSVLLGLAVLGIGRLAGRDAARRRDRDRPRRRSPCCSCSPSRTSRGWPPSSSLTVVAIVRLATIRAP